MTLQPDIAEARRFLGLIAPDGDVVFQTFDDDEDRKENDPEEAKKLAWSSRKFDALAAMNARRAGVFLTVNAVDGDRRKAEKVTRVRALFADFDGVELPTVWDIEPSVLVNTSPAKFHAYWLIDGDFPREEFPDAQRAIAARYGTDPVINDLPRVMRLPGFWHQKGEPYLVRIIEASGARYSVETLREWIDRITPEPEPEPEPERRYAPRSSLNGSVSPYVKAGVEMALANIATAGKGNRNNVLNSEAFGIFGLVKAGAVPETIRADIEIAAAGAGLTKAEIKATLNSAWTAARPRAIPEPRGRPDRGYVPPQDLPPHDPETGEVTEDAAEAEPEKKERKKEKPIRPAFDELPFRMLGHNKGVYYYLPKAGGQIIGLRAHEHTPLRLIAMAPLNHWFRVRGKDEEGKISDYQWQQIANGMIHMQYEEGIFEESRLRGRGAWMDGARTVVHTGSELIVDGQISPLMSFPSRFVYEAAASWDFGFGEPATNAEAQRLREICERLTWDDALSGPLLAGWCVVAPVSGALKWRPHIWILGPAGSGKSTAQNDIVGRVVGPAAERFDGKATEAAIRQMMGYDARPVIFDEAEGEDHEGAKRMQGILDLARYSSTGARIPKGGQNHVARTFIMRSCFCLSSIHSSIRHHADESRITKLVLRKNTDSDRDEHYRQLMRDISDWFTPEYASRMFLRTVRNMPALLANAETFTNIAASAIGNRRAADQLGPLLAGLYMLHSTGKVTRDAAEAFIRKHQWTDHVSLDSQEDHVRLFAYLMSRMMRVMTNDGPREMSVGQAIEDIGYARELGPRGIRVEAEMVWFANRSDGLSEMMKEKPQWQADWKRLLMLLPGAVKSTDATYFAPGLIQRSVGVPRGLLRG